MPTNDNATQPDPVQPAVAPEPPKPLRNAFVEDGYTRTVIIPASLTGYNDVKLCYRPIVADEDSKTQAWIRLHERQGTPAMDHFAPLLSSKIIDWNLKNQKGERVDHSEASIRRLMPDFYPVLIQVIDGTIKLPDINGAPEPDTKNS